VPLVAEYLEVLDNYLFDTLQTMAPRRDSGNRERMFLIPLGGMMLTNEGHRVKTSVETNMVESEMLYPPHQFLIKAIRAVFIGEEIVPMSSRYYADTLIRLIIGQKPYWTGPAFKCADPVTMDPKTVLEMDTESRIEFVKLLRRHFEHGPIIQEQEPFSVQVTFGESWRDCPPDAPDRLVVLLEGDLARAII
jgi:hypothetical protein